MHIQEVYQLPMITPATEIHDPVVFILVMLYLGNTESYWLVKKSSDQFHRSYFLL